MDTDLIEKLDGIACEYAAALTLDEDQYYKYYEDRTLQKGFGELRREKFAELIIRECCNVIHGADMKDLRGKEYYLDRVSEHIEKHFGLPND